MKGRILGIRRFGGRSGCRWGVVDVCVAVLGFWRLALGDDDYLNPSAFTSNYL